LLQNSFFIAKLFNSCPKDFSITLYISYGFADYLCDLFKVIPAIFFAASDEVIEIEFGPFLQTSFLQLLLEFQLFFGEGVVLSWLRVLVVIIILFFL